MYFIHGPASILVRPPLLVTCINLLHEFSPVFLNWLPSFRLATYFMKGVFSGYFFSLTSSHFSYFPSCSFQLCPPKAWVIFRSETFSISLIITCIYKALPIFLSLHLLFGESAAVRASSLSFL